MRDLLLRRETRGRLRLHHRRPPGGDQGARCADGPTRCGPRVSGSARSAPRRASATYEITTHRAEAYTDDSRKPDVEFADAGRDRPVAARLHGERDGARAHHRRPALVDPFGGAADLVAAHCARRSPRESSFSDDPLRMLRAARFIAGYHLQPVARARHRRAAMHDRLAIVSAERIRDELDKLIVLDHPAPGCGSSSTPASPTSSCPSCPAMRLEQDPIHRHKDVLTHTIAVVENVQPRRARPAVRLSSHPPGRAVPRRRQAEDPCVSQRARASPSTTTRWSGRA